MKAIYTFSALLLFLLLAGTTNTVAQTWDNPASIDVYVAPAPVTVDGVLEYFWNRPFNGLVFGPNAPTSTYWKSVTGGVKVGNNDTGPYTDTTYTYMKFLRSGMKLYIAFWSNDKYVGRFGGSWEGDGMFMVVQKADNSTQEIKLYYNGGTLNSEMVWDTPAKFGQGVGVRGSQTITNDTTALDNGYVAECVIYLDSLGYTTVPDSLPVNINIFDPDHYAIGQPEYQNIGTFYKSFWGVEWAGAPLQKKLALKSTVLPVELTSFTASMSKAGVKLDWSTASELNNARFEIQRSKDGSNFATVGTVSGKGTTTNVTRYSFIDNNSFGKSYYRLKQVDFNGDFSYSGVVEINGTVPQKFAVEQNYPNPFNPTTTINYSVPEKSNITLKVFDVLGREVATLVNGQVEVGNHQVTFDASKLSSGIYYYTLQSGNNISTKKMMLVK
jgi:hypothetical protein